MNKKEYEAKRKELVDQVNKLNKDIKDLEERYAIEVMKRNGYNIGDKVTKSNRRINDETYEITGGSFWALRPVIVGCKLKKDGTRSKVFNELYHIHLTEE